MAGAPLNLVSSSTVGPLSTKMRPSRPSESHDTSDCGPPDRNGVFGAAVSGLISLLAEAKVLFMVRIANLSTTPLRSVIVSTVSRTTTMVADRRNGAMRSTSPTRKRTSQRMNWPISTKVNSTTSDSPAATG